MILNHKDAVEFIVRAAAERETSVYLCMFNSIRCRAYYNESNINSRIVR